MNEREEEAMVTAGVPPDGPVQLGSAQLPAGRQLFGWDGAGPRLCATSEPVPEAGRVWRRVRRDSKPTVRLWHPSEPAGQQPPGSG